MFQTWRCGLHLVAVELWANETMNVHFDDCQRVLWIAFELSRVRIGSWSFCCRSRKYISSFFRRETKLRNENDINLTQKILYINKWKSAVTTNWEAGRYNTQFLSEQFMWYKKSLSPGAFVNYVAAARKRQFYEQICFGKKIRRKMTKEEA